MKATGLTLLLILMAALASALFPVRPYMDFQVLYHANLGLLRGIPVYDHARQVEMIAQLANVPSSQVFMLPFPYPPWYALSTLWLARLPIELAARAWLGLNILILLLSLALLTEGLAPLRRGSLIASGFLWIPVLGTLFVGQFGMPVLLGAALMIRGLRRESAPLVALAAVLLTFKPQLGGPLLVLTVIYLVSRARSFAPRALPALLVAGAALFASGFLASPSWPIAYIRSLVGFSTFGDIPKCQQCVSLSMALVRPAGGGLTQAAWVSLAATVLLGTWMAMRWREVVSTPTTLIMSGIALTILASPYLLNYDYLLLSVMFIGLAQCSHDRLHWIGLCLAYGLPFISLAVLGTRGNFAMIVSAMILFALLLRSLRLPTRGLEEMHAA